MKNFRGDLLQVVFDVKHRELDASGVVVHTANVLQVADGYLFGWEIKERSLSTDLYRFGFNGMENDPELSEGNQDFGARFYDGRIGRWWSVDPYKEAYPNQSPYVFSLNSPVKFRDEDGGYVVDEDGNIIFVPTGSPKFHDLNDRKDMQSVKQARAKVAQRISQMGKNGTITKSSVESVKEDAHVFGYYSQEGYILADDGTKVKVSLVVDENVYNATLTYRGGVTSDGRIKISKVRETVDEANPRLNNDATPNCAGLCLLEGKFVLYTSIDNDPNNSPAKDLLKGDGYERDIESPQKGDVGLYYEDEKIEHVEGYESNETVTSKGGVELQTNGRKPRGTWDRKYDSYEVVRKTTPNKKVQTKAGTTSGGIRTVNAKQFNDIQKVITR